MRHETDYLWGHAGRFSDDDNTRAALGRLGSEPEVIEEFAAAVADQVWMEITGPKGTAIFVRSGVNERWVCE